MEACVKIMLPRAASRAFWAAACALLSPPAHARDRDAVDALVTAARAQMATDPDGVVAIAAEIRRAAAAHSSARQRVDIEATALWLESEALVRLDRYDEAKGKIRQAKAILPRAFNRSRLAADIDLTYGGAIAPADVGQALSSYQSAFIAFQRLGDVRNQSRALIYLADLYMNAKDYDTAVRYLRQALELVGAMSDVSVPIHNNLGTILTDANRLDEARAEFETSLALIQKHKQHDLAPMVYRNIARLHTKQGRFSLARKAIAAGRLSARVHASADATAFLSVAARLAFATGEIARARSLIDRYFADIDPEQTSSAYWNAHETAYQVYKTSGDAARALAHLAALKRLDDEATKLATRTSTALMRARFDFANQELKIARLRQEELRRNVVIEQDKARSQRTIFSFAAAGALLVLSLLSFGLFTIRRSRNAVRAAYADLAVTNEALGNALAAKTEFLANTSHEIRTPLNGILGLTEVMLRDGTLPEDARERMRLVHGAGKTMRALVDDILDMAKIERGKLTLESEPFDLVQVLCDATRLWEDQIRAKGMRFDVKLDLPSSRVAGDATRVRQVVFNLLSNAVKFTEAGAITLTAVRELDGRCRIVVADTGVGIAPDKLEQVFESFCQADASTTRRFGGTGLGLTISRDLARAMGGELSATSIPDQGSTFTFEVALPTYEEPATSGATARPTDLLIVDPSPIRRAMFRSLLAPYVGEVATAVTLDEALETVATSAPRKMLIDEAVLADAPDRSIAKLARTAPEAAIHVLRSEGAAAWAASYAVFHTKPVEGPALIAAINATAGHLDYTGGLVSRAA
jgi:signal transduction histidine kinase